MSRSEKNGAICTSSVLGVKTEDEQVGEVKPGGDEDRELLALGRRPRWAVEPHERRRARRLNAKQPGTPSRAACPSRASSSSLISQLINPREHDDY